MLPNWQNEIPYKLNHVEGQTMLFYFSLYGAYKNLQSLFDIVHTLVILETTHVVPVFGGKRTWILNPDNDENVLELWADTTRGKGFTIRILENHCHYIIANVTFPQQLKEIAMQHYM